MIYHIDDNAYKISYSKKKLKRLFQRISKHLKRGILTIIISGKTKNFCLEDEINITILPNKTITNTLSDNFFNMSYEYLTTKVFPYIDKQTKYDLIPILNKEIFDLSSQIKKYSLLLDELIKD